MSGGRKHRPWRWALASSACLVVGIGMLAWFPVQRADVRDYEHAIARGDVRRVPATVTDRRRIERRRDDSLFVDLRLRGGDEVTVSLESSTDWETFDRGDEVEVVFWEGDVARLDRPRREPVETTASPLHDQLVAAVLGLVLVPWSAFGLWAAFRMKRDAGSWSASASLPTSSPSAPKAMGCGAAFLATGAALLSVGGAIYDLDVLLIGIAVFGFIGAAAGALLWLVGRITRRRSKRDRDGRDDDG